MLLPDEHPIALDDVLRIGKAGLEGLERFKIGDKDQETRARQVPCKGNDPLVRFSPRGRVMGEQQGDQGAGPSREVQIRGYPLAA